MINLAGVERGAATAQCGVELESAGICIVSFDPESREVQSLVGGRIVRPNGQVITLERAWYYWIAHGLVPLHVAQAIYADPVGRQYVRAGGDCGCREPNPEAEGLTRIACGNWYTQDGKELRPKTQEHLWDEAATAYPHAFTKDKKPVFVPDPAKEPGAVWCVNVYHIDTQEGLELFARLVSGGDR